MKYDTLIRELQLKVEQVSDKYKKMKDELPHFQNPEANEQVKRLMKELEMLSQKIKDQYAQVRKEENLNKKKLSEIEKNIYNSIRSFNSAYSSAGSIRESQ